MKTVSVTYHPYADDGRSKVCGHLRGDGEPCGLPQTNRTHKAPDFSRHQAEERRRLGEREDSE